MPLKTFKLSSGHTGTEMSATDNERLHKHNPRSDSFVTMSPGNFFFPDTISESIERINKFKFRKSDVYVMTFPKCGTTWVQELAWTLLHNPDLNHPDAQMNLDARSPPLEGDFVINEKGTKLEEDGTIMETFRARCPGKSASDGIFLCLAEAMEEPRLIKTHLPFSLLPKDALDTSKFIYVARDPKDVVVSYHHFCRLNFALEFKGTLKEYLPFFINGEVVYGPFFTHMMDAWQRKSHPNLLIVFYEDLKAQPFEEFKRIDQFLGTNRTDEQIKKMIDYTSFGSMKERMETNGADPPTSNFGAFFNKEIAEKEGGFFRKGIVGDWKAKFSPEEVELLTTWSRKEAKAFGKDFKYYTL